MDNDIVPKVDEAGRLQYDRRHFPILFLKDGVEHKRFYWSEGIVSDSAAYDWFHKTIHDEQSVVDMWRPVMPS